MSTSSSEVHEAADGAHPAAGGSPVAEPPVVAGPQVVHPAAVVGLLVHEPVAVADAAGVHLGHVEAVRDVGAIVAQVHHLPRHVLAVVQPHAEVSAVL